MLEGLFGLHNDSQCHQKISAFSCKSNNIVSKIVKLAVRIKDLVLVKVSTAVI